MITGALLGMAMGLGPMDRSVAHGRVVDDANGNGQLDAGELGLSNIWVSDGVALVRTDKAGRFRFDSPAGPLFVIKPPHRRFEDDAHGLPAFWDRGEALTEKGWQVALARDDEASSSGLSVRVFGDPQPKNDADVDYFLRDIVDAERILPRARFGLSLGDIVHSNLALLPLMARATASLGTPWLHVSGNHDRDHSAASDEASLESFRRVFGPDTFAWEEPGLSLVVLDNVIHRPGTGVPAAYEGGLREAQFRFLEAYLPMVDDDRLLVIATHMPLFDTHPDPAVDSFRDADRQRLFDLLEGRRHTLVLSGHTHLQQHRWHGPDEGFHGVEPLHEYNVGASCGAFWSGVKDSRGVPDARMADGTPNGFATLDVALGGSYNLRWHAAGLADDPPFALHAPKVLRRGAWPGVGVYANVWMGDAGTRVEYRIGEAAWRPMQRIERPDPALAAINAIDDTSHLLRGYDRAPEAIPSTHLWRGVLPTDLPVGEHRIEVRVLDRWRGELRQAIRYRLEEASP